MGAGFTFSRKCYWSNKERHGVTGRARSQMIQLMGEKSGRSLRQLKEKKETAKSQQEKKNTEPWAINGSQKTPSSSAAGYLDTNVLRR